MPTSVLVTSQAIAVLSCCITYYLVLPYLWPCIADWQHNTSLWFVTAFAVLLLAAYLYYAFSIRIFSHLWLRPIILIGKTLWVHTSMTYKSSLLTFQEDHICNIMQLIILMLKPAQFMNCCFCILQGTNVAAGKARGIVIGTGLNTEIGKSDIA